LLSINNMSESDWLIDGQAVMVRPPDDWIPPPTPTPSPTHIVQKGENLWYITSLYNIEMSDLLWLNGLTLDSLIRPGRELKVRLLPGEAPPPTPTPQLAHIVSSGDTLWSIALSYGLSLEELLAFNGLTADALLQLGDALLIRPNPTPTPMPTPVTVPTDAAPVVDLIDAVPVAEVIDVQQTLTPVVQQFSMEAQPIPTDVVDSAETDANPTNFGFILLAAAFVLLAGGALTLAMRGS
jgi:LysM repeat protein